MKLPKACIEGANSGVSVKLSAGLFKDFRQALLVDCQHLACAGPWMKVKC